MHAQLLRDALEWIGAQPLPNLMSLAADTAPRKVVDFAARYSELARAEVRSGGERTLFSHVNAYEAALAWTVAGSRAGIQVRAGLDGLGAEANDWTTDRGASVSQQLGSLGAAVWSRGTYLSGGLALAASLSEVSSAEGDEEGLLPSQPASWLALDSSLSYSLFVGGTVRGLSAQYRQSRQLLSACLPRIEVLGSGHFRTFPFTLSLGEHAAVVSCERAHWRVQLSGAVEQMSSSGSAQADNMLSTVTDWQFRVAEVSAEARAGKLGVGLEATVRSGGGYVEGYGKGVRYLVIDSADVLHVGGRVRLALPWRFRAGLFGDYVKAESPIGSLNAAPFTAWSVFRPTVYRLKDLRARCAEAGGTLGRDFSTRRRSTFSCDLSVAHVSAKVAYSRLERRVVVLIPVYVDSTRVTLVDWEGIDLGIRLRHQIVFRRVAVAYWLNQHLPVQTNSAASTASTEPSGEGDSRGGGGTSVGVQVRMDVGGGGRRLRSMGTGR